MRQPRRTTDTKCSWRGSKHGPTKTSFWIKYRHNPIVKVHGQSELCLPETCRDYPAGLSRTLSVIFKEVLCCCSTADT